ncbi:MAG: hypothetical protein C0175_03910 [Caldisericum exile]|uniref:Uncharacterized protein n=1 Tax=Caldisericum exile TaxID=693075 RepID=A0A2J6X6C0_9BACT|nr:MAG: hypothetical protein C0175_03910 [Caldisericum exile]
MKSQNKVKISAGLNYFLHKKLQEHIKEKNISLTYLIEKSIEMYFDEQKKIESNKKFEDSFATLAEVLMDINSKIDSLKNGK